MEYDIRVLEVLRVVRTLIFDIEDIITPDKWSDTWVITWFLKEIIWNNIETIIGIEIIIVEVVEVGSEDI